MSHVLLLGASGSLGAQVLAALGRDERVERVTCLGRDRCDLLVASTADLIVQFGEVRPTAVVNCTGRASGKVVLAYFEIGSIEEFRPEVAGGCSSTNLICTHSTTPTARGWPASPSAGPASSVCTASSATGRCLACRRA